jgi:hypothetical protein
LILGKDIVEEPHGNADVVEDDDLALVYKHTFARLCTGADLFVSDLDVNMFVDDVTAVLWASDDMAGGTAIDKQ